MVCLRGDGVRGPAMRREYEESRGGVPKKEQKIETEMKKPGRKMKQKKAQRRAKKRESRRVKERKREETERGK